MAGGSVGFGGDVGGGVEVAETTTGFEVGVGVARLSATARSTSVPVPNIATISTAMTPPMISPVLLPPLLLGAGRGPGYWRRSGPAAAVLIGAAVLRAGAGPGSGPGIWAGRGTNGLAAVAAVLRSAVAAADRRPDAALHDLDLEIGDADPDLGAGRDRLRPGPDAPPGDVGAVLAPEIAQEGAARRGPDDEVLARDVRVRQHDVVLGRPPDAEALLGHRVPRPVDDDDRLDHLGPVQLMPVPTCAMLDPVSMPSLAVPTPP